MSVKKPISGPPPENIKGFERQIGRMGYRELKKELNIRKEEARQAEAAEAKRKRKAKSERGQKRAQ